MIYEQFLGEDQSSPDLSLEHAAKQGMHDAVSTGVKMLFIGGIVLMGASLILRERSVKKIVSKFV